MIDVVCFCGCSYSFVGDAGTCPRCGELVSFGRPSANEAQRAGEGLEQLSVRPVDERLADNLAA
jgi:hypothetical protein